MIAIESIRDHVRCKYRPTLYRPGSRRLEYPRWKTLKSRRHRLLSAAREECT